MTDTDIVLLLVVAGVIMMAVCAASYYKERNKILQDRDAERQRIAQQGYSWLVGYEPSYQEQLRTFLHDPNRAWLQQQGDKLDELEEWDFAYTERKIFQFRQELASEVGRLENLPWAAIRLDLEASSSQSELYFVTLKDVLFKICKYTWRLQVCQNRRYQLLPTFTGERAGCLWDTQRLREELRKRQKQQQEVPILRPELEELLKPLSLKPIELIWAEERRFLHDLIVALQEILKKKDPVAYMEIIGEPGRVAEGEKHILEAVRTRKQIEEAQNPPPKKTAREIAMEQTRETIKSMLDFEKTEVNLIKEYPQFAGDIRRIIAKAIMDFKERL